MNRLLISTGLIMIMSCSAFAQDQSCREIDADLDRLACYDRVSGRTPKTSSVATESEWIVNVKASEMTDQKTVTMALYSEEPVTCSSYETPDKPVLIIRCLENTTSIYIATDCHLTSSSYNNSGDVTYRLDDTPSKTRGFFESNGNDSLGLWTGGRAIPFIKGMFGHNSMLTRFVPYSENAVTPRFNISGLEEAIEPLREACHW